MNGMTNLAYSIKHKHFNEFILLLFCYVTLPYVMLRYDPLMAVNTKKTSIPWI